MSYRVVTHLQEEAVSVSHACRILQVSRSGYYAYRRTKPCAKRLQQQTHVKAAFSSSGASYGSRRVMHALRAQGLRIGRYRVRTLMREAGLRTNWKRKFVSTTDSRHTLPVAENVLNRQFDVGEPNRAWVSDITYIRTAQGWLYLAVVLDLYSRRVVGWSMAPTMPAGLVISALALALQQRQPVAGLVLHSDRGSQYASDEYQALLRRHHVICSMSRKGNCWDNSVMERFFLNLKMERVWQRQYANHDEARCDINQYIVGFYNAVRLHSTLGYLSPSAYEAKLTVKNLSACPKQLDHYTPFRTNIGGEATLVRQYRSIRMEIFWVRSPWRARTTSNHVLASPRKGRRYARPEGELRSSRRPSSPSRRRRSAVASKGRPDDSRR